MDAREWLDVGAYQEAVFHLVTKGDGTGTRDDAPTIRYSTSPAPPEEPTSGYATLHVVHPRGKSTSLLAAEVFPGRCAVFVLPVLTPETDEERYALPDRLAKLLPGDAAVVAVGLGAHTAWLSKRLPEGRTLALVLDAEEVREVAGAAAAITAGRTAEIVGIRWARVDLVLVGSEEDRATFVEAFASAGVDGPGEVRVLGWKVIARWSPAGRG